MDGVRREALAIVEHLKKHNVVVTSKDCVIPWLKMGDFITEGTLQKYIEEAIYKFMKGDKK